MKISEIARKDQVIIFDKTGTLTKGIPSVTDVVTINEMNSDEILRPCRNFREKFRSIPFTGAMVRHAKKTNLVVSDPDSFKSITGSGVEAQYGDHQILIGNRKFITNNGITIDEKMEKKIQEFEEGGKTTIIICIDKKLSGIIAMMDTISDNALEAIQRLKKNGIQVAMLTGDNTKIANAIASKLGIDRVLRRSITSRKRERHSKNKGKRERL